VLRTDERLGVRVVAGRSVWLEVVMLDDERVIKLDVETGVPET